MFDHTISRSSLFAPLLALALLASACGSNGSTEVAGKAKPTGGAQGIDDAVQTYAAGVHASYSASLDSARKLDGIIGDFLDDPTDEGLGDARQAWLDARDDYGPTEAFRFYGGPIDNEGTGKEGLINAWPLDEAYIDYVDGSEDAGVINDPESFPTVDADLLTSLNEEGGESNISTGWHAIEFLLWGQDLDEAGPGARPFEDYTSHPNADRRSTYLAETSDLLVSHLGELEAAWAPDADNYRAEFEALDSSEAMTHIITGIGELSRGELAGERMNVAYAERSQEDEHSCFSDNTTNDIIGNAKGISMVLNASYPGDVPGTSILDVVATLDEGLASQLEAEVVASVETVKSIPAPFDQHLADGVSDDDPGRQAVLSGIEALEDQTETIVAAAAALGVTINVT